MHKPKIWERDLLKTYEKMTGFTEVFAKKNYLRVVEKSPTYGYTMFPVKQSHLPKEPGKVRSTHPTFFPRACARVA